MSYPKIKIAYFNGVKEECWEEGEKGVEAIVVNDGQASIYFKDNRLLTVYSPYMKVFSYYEAP